MNKWAILRSSTFHLLSILKPRKLGRNIYCHEKACWVQSMVRACCNPWTFGKSPVSHCWLLPDSIYCWTHPPSVSLRAHCTVSNICMANMSGCLMMPHDASGHKFGPFSTGANILLCSPATGFAVLASDGKRSRRSQPELLRIVVPLSNMSHLRDECQQIPKHPSYILRLPWQHLLAHVLKKHLANHFIMTCLIQPIFLTSGDTGTHTHKHMEK